MYPQMNENSYQDAGSVFRMIYVVLLGIYASAHVLFVPIEVIGIIYCFDPLYQAFTPFLVTAIIMKYALLIGMSNAVYNIKSDDVSMAKWVVYFCLVLMILLSGVVHYVALVLRQLSPNPFVFSPYSIDYIGLMVCGLFAIIYMVVIGAFKQQRSTLYQMVPVNNNFSYSLP